MIFFTGQGL